MTAILVDNTHYLGLFMVTAFESYLALNMFERILKLLIIWNVDVG